MAHHNEITASLWVQYTWFKQAGPNPITWRTAGEWEAQKKEEASAWQPLSDEIRRIAPNIDTTTKAINEQHGAKARVREQRVQRQVIPRSTWPGWHEPRDMIAIAMGAPEPLRINGMWWHDRNHYPLEHIESAAELAHMKVPDWSRVECVQRMLESRERWMRERLDEPAPGFDLVWEGLAVPGQGEVPSICYPSFVDMGVYLMGATQFFTVLGSDPELANAFMDLCFDLSIGYTEFLRSLKPEPFIGLCGFGGDATFFLSPALYERYSAAWDARLFDYVCAHHGLPVDAPCNLHSCGASAHLYESWGHHPCLKNITAMQTRLIPGTVGRLRAALPDTELELTLHPPEFDLAGAEPEAIRMVFRQSAADAEGRDAHFHFITAIHQPDDLPRLAANIEVILDEIETICSFA